MFSRLADNEADAILTEARIVSYAEGALIFAKGDPGNSMMAVLKGRVVISDPSPDGRHVVLSVFREGDVFGKWPSSTAKNAAQLRWPPFNASYWSCCDRRFCTS